MIKCKICNKEVNSYRALGIHIKKSHNINSQDYYDEYLKKEGEGFCKVCKKPTKFLSLMRGYSSHCSISCGVKDPEAQEKYKESCIKKYGKERASQSEEVKEKMRKTCLEKYGVENSFQLPEVREKSSNILKEKYGEKGPLGNDKIRKKSIATWEENYGVDNPSKAEKIKDKIKSKKDYKVEHEKSKQTCLEKYGVDNPIKDNKIKNKAKETCIEKYGVDNPLKSKEIREKIKQTKLEKYGNPNYHGVEKIDQVERVRKSNITKRKNGTFNTSETEEILYSKLINYFGENDVLRNYKSKVYPFLCDFYIKSLDLYIEGNFHWTHGKHWFDESNTEDINKVNNWKEKNTKYYNIAINTWTKRDINKRKISKKNNLNYIVFWSENEIDLWLSLGCPIGKDWKHEYSWLPNRKLQNKLEYKKLNAGQQNTIAIVKTAQFEEFYKRELELWNSTNICNNDKLQLNLYLNRLKYINKNPIQLSDLEIIRGLNISGKIKSFTTFDNVGMKEFIKKYNICSIFDPCAGWGERLVTCAALNIKYFGIDINKEVIKGHQKIINQYNLINQKTIYEDSSKYINVNNFDCTFTCPPYWNTEIYTNKGAENLSYDEFLIWWKHIILNSNTKIFAYQINQKYKDDMNKILLDLGYTFIEEIILNKKENHFTKNKKREYESIQVFKK